VKVRGFTLVELLVVIAVISLLAGISLPTLMRGRVIARRAKCRANLHGIGVALRMYLNDSDDIMPIAAQMPSLNLTEDLPICEVLEPFISRQELLQCPADTKMNYYASEGSSYEYHSMYGGRKIADLPHVRWMGEAKLFVMNDYEAFHGVAGELGAMNFLFADGHVGDLDWQ